VEFSNVLTDAERSAGFRLLFDGKTTAGFRGYRQPEIYPHWRVVDGTLRFHPDAEPKYGHDIITDASFTNFELLIDWVLYEGGNSGIMYHVRETETEPFMTGPEIQLLDDDRHVDAKNGPDRHTGACYGLYPPLADARSPIGQWNRIRLLVDGDHVEHHLNGVLVCTYDLGSEDWNRRVAASKFKDWPNFASQRHGHIVLQDHLDPVAFRNIKIRTW
jgi:hypothetical protein